jgi:hypothetical protein
MSEIAEQQAADALAQQRIAAAQAAAEAAARAAEAVRQARGGQR